MADANGGSAGALVRGVRSEDLEKRDIFKGAVQQGSLDILDGRDQAAIGSRLGQSMGLHAGHGHHADLAEGHRAPSRHGAAHQDLSRWPASSRSACTSTTAGFVFMPLADGAALSSSSRTTGSTPSRSWSTIPSTSARYRPALAAALAGTSARLVDWQQHNSQLLHRDRGRAQRHVPDPDADHPRRRLQHHLQHHHDGEGQGPRHRDPAHHGRDARHDPAHLRPERRQRSASSAPSPASSLGVAFAANIEQHPPVPPAPHRHRALFDPRSTSCRSCRPRSIPSEVASVVVMGLGLSFLATIYPSWRAARLDPVEALRYE